MYSWQLWGIHGMQSRKVTCKESTLLTVQLIFLGTMYNVKIVLSSFPKHLWAVIQHLTFYSRHHWTTKLTRIQVFVDWKPRPILISLYKVGGINSEVRPQRRQQVYNIYNKKSSLKHTCKDIWKILEPVIKCNWNKETGKVYKYTGYHKHLNSLRTCFFLPNMQTFQLKKGRNLNYSKVCLSCALYKSLFLTTTQKIKIVTEDRDG